MLRTLERLPASSTTVLCHIMVRALAQADFRLPISSRTGGNEFETLLAGRAASDWEELATMFLGPPPAD